MATVAIEDSTASGTLLIRVQRPLAGGLLRLPMEGSVDLVTGFLLTVAARGSSFPGHRSSVQSWFSCLGQIAPVPHQ